MILETVPPPADKYWQGTKITKRPYKQGPYTKQEIALLKESYPATSAVVMAAKLKRSHASVQRELRRLGIGRRKPADWTPGQLKRLRSAYKTMAIWEIANRLGKPPSRIKRKASELKLKK